jgi:hypothetical protein
MLCDYKERSDADYHRCADLMQMEIYSIQKSLAQKIEVIGKL